MCFIASIAIYLGGGLTLHRHVQICSRCPVWGWGEVQGTPRASFRWTDICENLYMKTSDSKLTAVNVYELANLEVCFF